MCANIPAGCLRCPVPISSVPTSRQTLISSPGSPHRLLLDSGRHAQQVQKKQGWIIHAFGDDWVCAQRGRRNQNSKGQGRRVEPAVSYTGLVFTHSLVLFFNPTCWILMRFCLSPPTTRSARFVWVRSELQPSRIKHASLFPGGRKFPVSNHVTPFFFVQQTERSKWLETRRSSLSVDWGQM